MPSKIPLLPSLVLLLAALGAGSGASAEPLSAAAAALRLQDGAQAWDLRPEGAALLPGAVRLAVRGQDDAAALARAVSAAGIDLSRDVLIYGEPGDAQAQALHARLARLASGRVDWLVGGLAEWQMSGRATVATPAQRLPVPQHLVENTERAAGRMAAAPLRDLPAADEGSTRLATR